VVLPVKLEQGEGWTRDVSAGGVFFTTQGALSSGERNRFTLVLEHVDPNGALAIPCEGQVVRVESQHTAMGVAVRFSFYDVDSRKAPWGLA